MRYTLILSLLFLSSLSFAQTGQLTYNGQSGIIIFTCGNTPTTPQLSLDYTVTLKTPKTCDCGTNFNWIFRLRDDNNNIVSTHTATAVQSTDTYTMTFSVDNKPEKYNVHVSYAADGFESDCFTFCSKVDDKGVSNTIDLKYPNNSSPLIFTGNYFAINNGVLQLCEGEALIVNSSGCETKYQAFIEELDANGNPYFPPSIVHTGNVIYGSPNGFDFTSLNFNFVSGTNYKLHMTTFFPEINFSVKINYNSYTSISVTQPNDFCEGDNILVNASGPAPLSWVLNGNLVNTGPTLSIPSAGLNDAGVYTIQSGGNCVAPSSVEIVVHPKPSISANSNIFFCADEQPYDFNNEITLLPSGIQGTYNWSSGCAWDPNGIWDYTGNGCDQNTNVHSISGTHQNFKFTSSEGCVSNEIVLSWEMNESPKGNGVITSPLCHNSSDGSIDLTVDVANNPYSINWSNSATTDDIQNLIAGDYTVTITDDDGCSTSEIYSVSAPLPLILNPILPQDITHPVCTYEDNTWPNPTPDHFQASSSFNYYGSVDISWSGGTGPYNPQISPDNFDPFQTGYANYGGSISGTSTTLQSLIASYNNPGYDIRVIDANGCISTEETKVILEAEVDIHPELSNEEAKCVGVNDGELSLSPINDGTSGATTYSYLWSNSSTNSSISNLNGAGNYDVTITSAEGCKLYMNDLTPGFDFPVPFTVDFNPVIQPGCTGVATGEITADDDATTPSYLWSNGETTQTIDGLIEGIYAVTVTETNAGTPNLQGCQVRTDIELTADPDRWQQKSNAYSAETAEKIVTDDNGNVYVLGTFVDEATFGTTTIKSYTNNPTGLPAYYVAKYDECGNLLWISYPEIEAPTTSGFSPADIEIIGSDIYVFSHLNQGNFTSFDFNSTHPLSTPANGVGGSNFADQTFVIRIDEQYGNFVSKHQFPQFNFQVGDIINDVEFENSQFYLAGRKNDFAEIRSYVYNSNPTTVISTNATNGTTSNEFTDIEFNGSSELYAVGTTQGNIDIDGQQLNVPIPVDHGFIIRYNSSFVAQDAAFTFIDEHTATALEIDDANGYSYVCGNAIHGAQTDMYVTALNSSLVSQWTSQYDLAQSTMTYSDAVDLIIDKDDHVVVTGSFQGSTVHITDNGSSQDITGDNQGNDLWIGAFDKGSGLCEWLVGAQSQEGAEPTSLATGSGNNYVAGNFLGTLDFMAPSTETSIVHNSSMTSAMFAVRFGTQYHSGAQFYKWDTEQDSEEEKSEQNFNLFPNPTTGELTMNWTHVEGTAVIHIFDVTGRVVMNEELNAELGTHQLDLSGNQPGTYFVSLSVGSQTWRETIIKY